MIASILKIAARVAALVLGAALIIGVFSVITIPNFDITPALDYLNKAYTVANHWVPGFSVLWSIILTLLTMEFSLYGVKFGLIAIKWALKVSE